MLPVAVAPVAGGAQPPVTSTPPEVGIAQAALRAGLADSAIRVLEGFFNRNPDATAGWLLLGNAYQQQGDLEKALGAFRKVTVPPPARLQATFSIASIHARRDAADSALAVLERLKASGAFDMELAAAAPAFANLRSHPRFIAAQFQPADFARPFVEPVRVIHEWVGETKGDQFSWIARGIGDVDGDKVTDIVTSAPTYGAAGQSVGRGRVYVYSGRSGKLLWQRTGEAGETLGIGLEGAGDVNRDGIGDVVAGAPGSGRAWVFSGADGATLHSLQGTAAESFGNSSAGAGDLDGDGHADIIVGAPASNVKGQGSGRAYVYSGRSGALLATMDGERAGDGFGSIVAGDKWGRGTPLIVGAPRGGTRQAGKVYVFRGMSVAPHLTFESDSTGAALGAMFASLVGDIDGDGVPDVYATDFVNRARGAATGRVYVRSGATGLELRTLTGENPGDGFGIGSADVGDVNKDGHDDLLIGAWQYSAVAASGGKVYLFSGRDGTLLQAITGRIPGETLGFDATGVGDVDGDGVIDLLVTSTWSNVKGFRSGRMFVISGKRD